MEISSTLVKFDEKIFDNKKINDLGKILYNENPFMRSVANIMENPELRNYSKIISIHGMT